MNKTFIVLITAIILSPLFTLLSSSPARADWLIDGSGSLVKVDGSILGDDNTTEVIKEASQNEIKQEPVKSNSENVREQAKQKLENQVETRKKIQEKNGETSKFKIERLDNKLKINHEVRNKKGEIIKEQKLEMQDGESLHIEQADGQNVEIKPDTNDKIEIIKNRIKAKSDLQLKVGEKNEISVTLPNGKIKEIKIPDQALENLVAKGIIAPISSDVGGSTSYELIAGKNGEPVYQANGVVEKKLFGLFKMKFAQKIDVAASDAADGSIVAGEIVNTQTTEVSPIRRFWERLSI